MIADFVIKLLTGITLMWCIMPRRDVTDGFFKIQMRVVLGLSVLAFLLLRAVPQTANTIPSPSVSEGMTAEVDSAAKTDTDSTTVGLLAQESFHGYLCLATATVCYLGSVVWAIGRRGAGNVSVWLAAALSALTLVLRSLRMHDNSGPDQQVCELLQLFADGSSAALLGSIVTAMLLGHWYLTSPTMSVRPLLWLNVAIVVAVVMRAIASATIAATATVDFSDTTVVLWLVLRWLGAIVAPAVAAVMVWRIMKYRNTQSATGVLFAGVIMVFMGEMAAALLQRQVGVPL